MTQKRTRMLRRHKRFRAGLWGPLAALLIMCGASPGQAQDIDIHGFFSQGYLLSTGNNFLNDSLEGDFTFTEVGLNFGTQLTDDLRFGLQLYSRSLGKLGKMALELDWAFMDYSISDTFNLRVGRIKQPYGLFGEYQDLDLTRATVILPQSVYFLGIRDLLVNFNGIQVYGNIDVEDYSLGNFDYQLCVGNLMGSPVEGGFSSVAQFFENRGYNEFTDTYAVDIGELDSGLYGSLALQWNTPFEKLTDYDYGGLILKLTASFYQATVHGQLNPELVDELKTIGVVDYNFNGAFRYDVPYLLFWVGSLEYTYESFVLTAEYSRYFSVFGSDLNPIVPHSALNQEAFYVQAAYRFSDWMELASYVSIQFDPDCRDGMTNCEDVYSQDILDNPNQLEPRYKAWMKDYAVALRFDVNDYWLVKIEGHFIDGTARVYERLNTGNPNLTRYWTLFGAKTTLTF